VPDSLKSVLFKTSTPKVAVLLADGYSTKDLNEILDLLIENGAKPVIVSSNFAMIKSEDGDLLRADRNMSLVRPRDFDAVFIPSGEGAATRLIQDSLVIDFIAHAFMHHRVIGASGSGARVVCESNLGRMPVFNDMHLHKMICSNGLAIAAKGTAIDVGMDFIYAIADRMGTYQAEYTA
jgi:putative intracellular protease/amidase